MKRYLYIILGILAAAAIAIFLIFAFKNPVSISNLSSNISGLLPSTGNQGGSGTQSGSGSGAGSSSSSSSASGATGGANQIGPGQKFGIVSDAPMLDYFVDASNTIAAIETDGTVISIANGKTSTLSSSTISNIIAAKFSYDGKKILVSFGDASNPQTALFDMKTHSWTSVAYKLFSPKWAPSSYQIAYLSQASTGTTALAVIDAANPKKAPSTLFSLHATDLSLQWISKSQFVLSDRPTINNAGSMWLFSSQTGALTPILYEVSGIESAWGSMATATIGLVFQGQNQTLQLMTPSGSTYHSLSFVTLPSKCGFGSQTSTSTIPSSSPSSTPKVISTVTPYLYCGIPTSASQLSSAQLPDDYDMMSLFTSDEIMSINLASGERSVLWNDASQNIDASDLKQFNGAIFFVNRYDKKLYEVQA